MNATSQMTYEELMDLATRFEGKQLETVTGKKFTVGVSPVEEDAEPEGGPRTQAMAEAARQARIGLIGGIIHNEPTTGRRTSRALAFDATGNVVARYEKLHLPEEPGFWETSHYEPGTEAPRRIDAFGLPIGIQVCSDNNRPEGLHLLGAEGAMAIFVPRASEEGTYQRWKI